MAVPGRRVPDNAPADLAARELFAVDAYLREFEARGRARSTAEPTGSALRRTAFYPGGGGQPHDLGTAALVRRRGRGDPGRPATRAGSGTGWTPRTRCPTRAPRWRASWTGTRRHLTMRTHTALHILCGVMWADHGVAVTGGNMEPGKGRLDFPLPSMSAEFGRQVEARINEEIAAAHDDPGRVRRPRGRRRGPRADPHRRQPHPARDRPAAGDRHRRSGQAGRRRHARAVAPPRSGTGRGDRHRVEGQGQQAGPARGPRPGVRVLLSAPA